MTPAEERLAAAALLRQDNQQTAVTRAAAEVLEQSVWDDGELVGDVPGFLDDAIEALARAILGTDQDAGRPA